MAFCYNCDIETAQFKCGQCPDAECLFCNGCKELHCKIKAYKNHQFTRIAKKVITCTNCEASESKFVCKNCDESNKYLCLGCSVIHPKIKAFRNHNVVPMSVVVGGSFRDKDSFSFNTANMSDSFVFLLETAYSNVSSKPVTDPAWWQTVAVCLVITILYYNLVNLIFRKYSTLVNIGVAIGLYQWLQSDKFKVAPADKSLTEEKKKFTSPTLAALSQSLNGMGGIFTSSPASRIPASWNVDAELNKDDFKGEFWYSTESKKASMRPRTRPYKARRPAATNSEESASPTLSSSAYSTADL